VIPRKMRVRRSTKAMARDPVTLIVAPNEDQKAEGWLYTDDGETLRHQQGQFVARRYIFDRGVLRSELGAGGEGDYERNTVERLVFFGQPARPNRVMVSCGGKTWEAVFDYDAGRRELIVRKPSVMVDKDWSVAIE
jgi:mannosyl-oligosaccharide alpha-1,3-glucosidase